MSRRFKKIVLFWADAMVTTQDILLAKQGNERNYETKHCMFVILG